MRSIAIVNQKGGCGKTTTVINLAAGLAAADQRVLLIDLDPQAHASIGLGLEVDSLERSVYDLFAQAPYLGVEEVVVPVGDRLDVAPAQLVLSAVEQEWAGKWGRENVLASACEGLSEHYDYLLIDSPPSLGLLTFNGLRACAEALIPIDMSVYGLQGAQRLLETIGVLEQEYGHRLEVRALATNCDVRTRFAREMLEALSEQFGDQLCTAVIGATIKLREAAAYGLPIEAYLPRSQGAADYRFLASELLAPAAETVADLVEVVQAAPSAPLVDAAARIEAAIAALGDEPTTAADVEPVDELIKAAEECVDEQREKPSDAAQLAVESAETPAEESAEAIEAETAADEETPRPAVVPFSPLKPIGIINPNGLPPAD